VDIKPIKLIKGISGTNVEPELDAVNKPKTPVKAHTPATHDGLELRGRALFLDGQDVGALILQTANENPQKLAALANALERLRSERLKNRKTSKNSKLGITADDDDLSLIWTLAEAHMARIGQLIRRRYDAKKDGLAVMFDDDGQFILNGLNVHALIDNVRNRPSAKARLLLKGVRVRMEHILQNRHSNPYYIQIRDVVLELCFEIDELLSVR
jgi:hypothetical protein